MNKSLLIVVALFACQVAKTQVSVNKRVCSINEKLTKYRLPITELEKRMIEAGLVDISTLDSSILLNIKYTSPDNFVGVDLYGDFSKCYLQKEVAEMLVKAQQYLQEINPKLTIMVYDGTRPRSVQQKMWDVVKMPIEKKVKFLSNPKRGSIHNYGCAVDVTIATIDGEELDMGSPFDDMGIIAYPSAEQKLLEEGVLTSDVIENRQLLRKVMRMAGFFNIQSEWWHFNSCTRQVAMEKYEIIE